MGRVCDTRKSIQGHPCFGGDRCHNGRIHLAVAPRCNIKCRYCNRRHHCANESRPGVTSRILTPAEALERVREIMASPSLAATIKVVGIAGPGDPLANEETFTTFRLIGGEFPGLLKCLSSNGLALPENIERLSGLGLDSLTITINAVDPKVGGQIYSWVRYKGILCRGTEGAELLIRNQLEGMRLAALRGIAVKVNTVLIPGVNEGEVEKIALAAKRSGATIMNVMPLIPQGEFSNIVSPSSELLTSARTAGRRIIGQFEHCRQCRADAVGLVA